MRKLLYSIAVLLILTSCSQNTSTENVNEVDSLAILLQTQATKIFAVMPDTAVNPENPLTAEKVLLGKTLYHDVRLSKKGTQSCNTCHNLNTFGVDNLPTSPGDNGTLGTRNSPTVIHSGIQFVQFWDGREKDVEAQAGGPILNAVEMGMPNEKYVIDVIAKVEGYKALFAAAFPDEKNPITYDNVKKAIGAFERTLMPKSAFDNYLSGDLTALDSTQQVGLKTFIDKGCTTCHIGAGVGGSMYQKFGLFGNYWDYTKSTTIDSGRYAVTKQPSDMFIFKTSMLRNVSKTGPYFHDGSVKDLSEAVTIMAKVELNQELTAEETKNIVSFLETLTAGLTPEQVTVPEMPK